MLEQEFLKKLDKYIYADLFCPFLNDLRKLKLLNYSQPPFIGGAYFVADLKNFQIIGSVDLKHQFEIEIFKNSELIYNLNNKNQFNAKLFSEFLELLTKKSRKCR